MSYASRSGGRLNASMPMKCIDQIPVPIATAPARQGPTRPARLSYKERLEFETLPERIAALEAEEVQLQGVIAGPDFYRETATFIKDTMARLEEIRHQILEHYQRWDALDSRQR